VRRDLPARQVDRLQAGLDHLHGLAAGQRAESAHVATLRQQAPEALGTEAGERALGDDRAAQAHDLLGGVRALAAGPPPVLRPLPFQLFHLLLDPILVCHLSLLAISDPRKVPDGLDGFTITFW